MYAHTTTREESIGETAATATANHTHTNKHNLSSIRISPEIVVHLIMMSPIWHELFQCTFYIRFNALAVHTANFTVG